MSNLEKENRISRVLWLGQDYHQNERDIAALRKTGEIDIIAPVRKLVDAYGKEFACGGNFSGIGDCSEALLDMLYGLDLSSAELDIDWELINRAFDTLVIDFNISSIRQATRNFIGSIVLRTNEYWSPDLLTRVRNEGGDFLEYSLRRLGRRLTIVGPGYSNAVNVSDPLARSYIVLPPMVAKGELSGPKILDRNKSILIYFPEICLSDESLSLYAELRERLLGVSYQIVGPQSVIPEGKNIAFQLDEKEAEGLLRRSEVILHVREVQGVVPHYLVEAMKCGIPILYFKDTWIDRHWGRILCGSTNGQGDVFNRVAALLEGNSQEKDRLLASQEEMLGHLQKENEAGLEAVFRLRQRLLALDRSFYDRPSGSASRKYRVAVILSGQFREERLMRAIALLEAVVLGASQLGECIDALLLHPEDDLWYSKIREESHPVIEGRQYTWRIIDASEAKRAMRYAGFDQWIARHDKYAVLEDNLRQGLDCDLFIFMAGDLTVPLIPLRPYVVLVSGFLQRFSVLEKVTYEYEFLDSARNAECVVADTDFAYRQVLQFVGLRSDRVIRLPQLPLKRVASRPFSKKICANPYFIWILDFSEFGNIARAFQALRIYYEELDGIFEAMIIGAGSKSDLANAIDKNVIECKFIKKRCEWCGVLSRGERSDLLKNARFAWFPERLMGSADVLQEAMANRLPVLSADHALGREVLGSYPEHVGFFDAGSQREIAEVLKAAERVRERLAGVVPEDPVCENMAVAAEMYWKVIRKCL